jgi:hypothetical protein
MVAEHQEPPRSGRDGMTANTHPLKHQKVVNATVQPETCRSSWTVKVTERAKEAM